MNIHQTLTTAIKHSINQLDLPDANFTLEHPSDMNYGDYAANVAMVTFPQLSDEQKQTYPNPRQLAEGIIDKLNQDSSIQNLTSKIEVAGPGFINFTLSAQHLLQTLPKTSQENFGRNTTYENKRIVVEYTDPNPFKEFHIGHLYSNAVGESLALIMESSGATVWRADYLGDVGMHVANSIWGLIQKLEKDNLTLNDLSKWELSKRIEYLGQSYALGASNYKEDESVQPQIKQLNALIFSIAQEHILPQYQQEPVIDYSKLIDQHDFDLKQIQELYLITRQWSLDYFETIYQRVGTNFDGYYPESYVGEQGHQLVQENIGHVFESGDNGAIIYPGEKHGLHTRVFINSLGLPTYEAKELGLAPAKFTDFPYDLSLIVTGKEINEYFQVLLSALKKVDPKLGDITTHIGHGMVRLPEGKMSSRTGKILRGEWLIDKAKSKILDLLKDRPNLSSDQADDIAEAVAVGAIKYAFLKQNIGDDIAFDFDTSLSFEGNSGPYLQYTHARCQSVLEKSDLEVSATQQFDNLAINPEELQLLRYFYRYPEIVHTAAVEYAPHHLCTYLYQLATYYNTFYNKHSILSADADEQKHLRLQLTQSTAIILRNGLSLLGISTPEKM